VRYTNNAIFTAIRNAVKAEYADANCVQMYTPTPAKFPTVFAREIGHFTPQQAWTLTNAQDISERTWEVQVFSNLSAGSKEQAYDILDICKDVMRSLYFLETFEQPIDQQDKSIYCLVARFRRVIGGGEEMPTS
jgi:hypothetical protein